MADPYERSEKGYWEERIRRRDRYTAIGRRSLPGRLNRSRKEALFPVIDTALDDAGVDLASSLVLDAGCGTGVYAEHYASRGARVVGLDLSREALRSTRAHGVPGSFCVAGLATLPLPDDHFDVTHVFSVLYHVVDDRVWRASLGELCRVTRPGGILLMRIEWVEESARIADHVKHRARNEYIRVLSGEEGFELEEVRSFQDIVPLHPLVALCHRILPSSLSDAVARWIEGRDLLRVNPSQKVVVFRKGRGA